MPEKPEIDSVGQSTPSGMWRVRAVKTRYFEIYFYSVPYSNETLYMKALEYKTYFTHIDSE
jgi:hypothetical protein